MKIIKRSNSEIVKEQAHGGSGARKVYANSDYLQSSHFEAMTHGYLPAGNIFDWHNHPGTEEVMIVLKGSGKVADEDDEYEYNEGDVFVFPADVQHKISNTSEHEHEMIFLRVKV